MAYNRSRHQCGQLSMTAPALQNTCDVAGIQKWCGKVDDGTAPAGSAIGTKMVTMPTLVCRIVLSACKTLH